MLTVQCPSCGSFNDDTATICYFCKKPLPISPDQAVKITPQAASGTGPASGRRASGYKRPGCIGLYSALTLIGGISGIFSLFVFLGNASSVNLSTVSTQLNYTGAVDPNLVKLLPAYFAIVLIVLFIFSVLNLVVGWGLWTMRNWARIYVLASQGLSILTGVPLLFFSVVVSKGSLCIGVLYLFPLAISGYIFLWFFENRNYFR
jgi:uncharacterized membrane protein (DUF2068 family)